MRRTLLLAAAGAAALLWGSATPSMAQSESDFVKSLCSPGSAGCRPIPKFLQQGHSGVPVFNADQRPSAAKVTSYERPTTTEPQGVPTKRKLRPAVSAGLTGCPAQPDTSDKPQQSTNNISFEFGSAVLTPEAKEVLRNLGHALNGQLRDAKSIEIDGYTDAVGGYQYNARLSQSRAAAAKAFLVDEMHISAGRLIAVGRSYCDPVDPAHPDSAANRRVVVVNQAG